jgi:hypothetical protein
MSVPPPGGWPPASRPDSGQPGPGYPGAHPQQPYPGPQGPWPPQPGYPPPVPPSKGNGLKWLLGGLAVLLVIGLAVTTTLLLTRDKHSPTGTSSAPNDVASANDTGPVSIITVEPTCTAYYSIHNSVAAVEGNGWGEQRNSLGAATQWTPEQRSLVNAVADALQRASDQMVPLAKQTPHRVVRELYEQIIAYMRAYVASIPTYEARDNWLAYTFVNAEIGLVALCNAISEGSAPRAVVDSPGGPTSATSVGDPANPQRFVTKSDATCEVWIPREDKYVTDTDAWSRYDTSIPATSWTPEQRAANEAVFPVMTGYADAIEKSGRSSGNPTLEDFAATAATYLRAFVAAGTNYVPSDAWVYVTGARLANVVTSACQAAVGQ